jgi:hypothetical protein
MSRTPPVDVIRALRTEVGFGCPVPMCGNPYLEWHHFDPPFATEAHHRPEGMIALCAEHHRKADAGAYTADQLREFKANKVNAESVRGTFDWLRNDLLAVVGGNFYYETLKVLVVDGQDTVWFRRDEDGYLRLNVRVPSLSPEPRAVIEDNLWHNIGDPADLRSPPSGRALEIRYATGDRLAVEFFEIQTQEDLYARYRSEILRDRAALKLPITVVEVTLHIGGTEVSLAAGGTTLPGNNQIRGGFVSHCGTGCTLQLGVPWRQNTSPSQLPRYRRLAPCPCKSGIRYKACHGFVR